MDTTATRRAHPLRVEGVERLCADAVAVTFALPDELAELYAFRPGQSLTLRQMIDGRDERRTYSICSRAGRLLRIGVREVPGGLFSSWLVNQVRPGDVIDVLPPNGSFTADLLPGSRHVLVAAGSGITPMMSIAASALAVPGTHVTVLYGNRSAQTVMFADELADLKDAHPDRLELVHVLSREPREAELFSGRLDARRLRALIPRLIPVEEVDHWWFCGPYGMVGDGMDVLADLGVPRDRVHRELFYVEDTPPVRAVVADPETEPVVSTVTVTLDGRTTVLGLPADVAVLDGVQRVRPDLPFACKGGVCGTCRAKVVDGEVRMRRNFALDPAELAAGYVLTCQAVPVSEKVEVSFDL